MAKVIRFNNCIDCPFGKEGIRLRKNDALCPMGPDGKRRSSWLLVWDANKPPKNHCPFPKGIIFESCKKCPYVKDDWGTFCCPKIRKKSLIKIPDPDKFHKDCPLEGGDNNGYI
jgi:hypothetical protein